MIDTTKILADKYLPGLGHEVCFLQDEPVVKAIYLRIPIAIIITVNCVFYILTAINIWWTQHQQYVRIQTEKAE